MFLFATRTANKIVLVVVVVVVVVCAVSSLYGRRWIAVGLFSMRMLLGSKGNRWFDLTTRRALSRGDRGVLVMTRWWSDGIFHNETIDDTLLTRTRTTAMTTAMTTMAIYQRFQGIFSATTYK